MSKPAYRVALVGAGGISRHHSRACKRSDRVHLAAVCDVSQAAEGTERFQFDPLFQFKLQLEHLCDVLDGSAEPRISARDSIAQMRVIDAVCESIASGSAVKM